MTRLLFIGDVHSNITRVRQLLDKEKVDAVFQVGDFELYHTLEEAAADKKALKKNGKLITQTVKDLQAGALQPFEVPIYFINGNHEDFNSLESEELKRLNIIYMKPGTVINIKGVRIGGIGGIHSPIKVKWKTSELTDKLRRFFTEEDISNLYEKVGEEKLDILITHQGASNVLPDTSRHEGTFYFESILKKINPRYYLHGHHHINYKNTYNNTEVIGLGHFGKNHKSHKVIEI